MLYIAEFFIRAFENNDIKTSDCRVNFQILFLKKITFKRVDVSVKIIPSILYIELEIKVNYFDL